VATTARLAAEEYGLGVRDGVIVLAPEVDEAKLFLAEARKAAGLLPASYSVPTVEALARILAQVERTGSPDSVLRDVESLIQGLARAMQVTIDEVPAEARRSTGASAPRATV
jgi:hypothetical protein